MAAGHCSRRLKGAQEKLVWRRDDQDPCGTCRQIRTRCEALLHQANKLSCKSWNGRMPADGEPIDPSPTIDYDTNKGIDNCRSNGRAVSRPGTWTWTWRPTHLPTRCA
jgi:hypothetical protein